MSRLAVQTACPESSIWRDIPEAAFRQHLVDLEKQCNAVPIASEVFTSSSWTHVSSQHKLSVEEEQQTADDFAFLVAVNEGAQSVSAVCIEENTILSEGLTLRIAALDTTLGDDVTQALKSICGHLTKIANKTTQTPEDVEEVFHDIKQLRQQMESSISSLALLYTMYEQHEGDEIMQLKHLVRATYHFCINHSTKDFVKRLLNSVGATPTSQVQAAINQYRQLEKIAAYYRIATFLARIAVKHSSLFKSGIAIDYLKPYESTPTTIAHESWAHTCHVHAEVQLAVHYDLKASSALYDQWTIPDLVEFDDETVARYRDVIARIDSRVLELDGHVFWRPEPLTSRQDFALIHKDDGPVTGGLNTGLSKLALSDSVEPTKQMAM
ncbi:unnamed protein product [Aureobasidium pullulans]|nr:unnamed protein product [Aureobasidium pullulans]